MAHARTAVRAGLVGLAALVTATCRISDVLTAPGVRNVALSYRGDTIVVVGSVVRASAQATAEGVVLDRAQFAFRSSDTTVLALRGDTLDAKRRGTDTLTITLVSSVLPSEPPSLSRVIRVVVDTVTVDSGSVTFTSLGDTVTLAATAFDANGEVVAAAPTWVSSDTNVVGVSGTGRLLAKGNGAVTVRAIVDLDTVAVPVTVQQVLVRYTFQPAAVSLIALADTQRVVAAPRDARGNPIAGTAPTWAIEDPSIAIVNATGLVTSLINGRTLLHATRGTVDDTVTVTVDQRATIVSVTPNPPPAITSISDQLQLTARAFDRRGIELQQASPAWFTGDPAVLRVSTEGLVTGLAVGTGRVFATLDGSIDSVSVPVRNDPARVIVAPDTALATSLQDTLIFTAVVRNGRGDIIPGAQVAWRSPVAPAADSTIGKVLADGSTIALKVGTARVIASFGGKADTAIAVVTNNPAVVDIAATTRTFTSLGDQDTPSITVTNARGVSLGRGAVIWSSDDPAIARVSATGVVTAVDTGSTYVRATSGLLTDSILAIVQNNPASVVISGSTVDTMTALGQSLPFTVTVRNARTAVIANWPLMWLSENRLVIDTADLNRSNTAVAIGFGASRLIVVAATKADTVTVAVRNPTRLIVDNGVVNVSPRVGTLARPYLRIQDAVNAADANDTLIVRVGSGPYSETVALSRSLTILGDSASFMAGSRNSGLLPVLAHDSGAAGILVHTTARETIRFLTIVHTLDGPAIDADGSDLRVSDVFVNRSTAVTSRIGRGISIKNSPSGTFVGRAGIDSVRGYAVRLENVTNAQVFGTVIRGVDSVAGQEEGAGIKVVSGAGNAIHGNLIVATQAGVLVQAGATTTRVDTNIVSRNTIGLSAAAASMTSVNLNDYFDNDTAGVFNPLAAGLTASASWWGDDRGPRRNAVPLAAGDSAAGNVTFLPVRAAPLASGTTAAALRRVRGEGQSASRGNTLSKPLVARVVDANGLPVAGVIVTFTATSGGGTFGGQPTTTATTNASGLGEATFTLGPVAGVNIVTVSVGSAAVGAITFTLTGT